MLHLFKKLSNHHQAERACLYVGRARHHHFRSKAMDDRAIVGESVEVVQTEAENVWGAIS